MIAAELPPTLGNLAQTTPSAAAAAEIIDLPLNSDTGFAGITGNELASIKVFYESHGNRRLWVDPLGILRPEGSLLLERLIQIDGMRWSALAALTRDGSSSAKLELLLSVAFAATAIDPSAPAQKFHGSEALDRASETSDIIAFLRKALPTDPAFWRLRSSIDMYREIATRGGWLPIPQDHQPTTDLSASTIMALCVRLLMSGDLTGPCTWPEHFDDKLATALRKFQARHGLEMNGIMDTETLSALNVSIERRIATMKLNLSRALNEDRAWGSRYLMVNVAAASYELVEGGHTVVKRPAIVGQPGWPTPRIDSAIEQLDFHPYWTVPPRIAKLELWPRISREPDYLQQHHMKIIDGKIRQDPGPDNPLGVVKFVFPNAYSVYLHDTNHPEFFARANRFRSHGCIRVSGAVDLAKMLLKDDPAWPETRIESTLAGRRNIRIRLTSPLPIHVVYDTAWVDDAGVVQFRDDVYHLDRSVPITLSALGRVAAE